MASRHLTMRSSRLTGVRRSLKEYLRKVSGKEFYVVPYVVFTAAFVSVRGTPKGVGVIPGKWPVQRIEQGRAHLDADVLTGFG